MTQICGSVSSTSTPKTSPIFLAVSEPPTVQRFGETSSVCAARAWAYASQPGKPQAPQFVLGRSSLIFFSFSLTWTANFLNAIARTKPKSKLNPPKPMTAFKIPIVSILGNYMYFSCCVNMAKKCGTFKDIFLNVSLDIAVSRQDGISK